MFWEVVLKSGELARRSYPLVFIPSVVVCISSQPAEPTVAASAAAVAVAPRNETTFSTKWGHTAVFVLIAVVVVVVVVGTEKKKPYLLRW